MALAGGAQGLVFWILRENWPELGAALPWFVAILTWLVVSTMIGHFADTGTNRLRLAALAAMIATVFCLPAFWVGHMLTEAPSPNFGDGNRAGVWIVVSVVCLYVAGPFIQILHRSGTATFPYDELFNQSWKNAFVIPAAGLFVATVWVMLWVWASLFDLIDVDFFKELFREDLFIAVITGAVAGFAVAVARRGEAVTAIKDVCVFLLSTLMPVAATVAAVFLMTLLIVGIEPLWATHRASKILVTWAVGASVLINAVFGMIRTSDRVPESRWREIFVALAVITNLVLISIAVYGISTRIEQYGFTVYRIYGAVAAGLLFVYSAGLAVSVISRDRLPLFNIETVNKALAAAVILVGLVLHTPLADPWRLSANDQLTRLVDGRTPAETFDYEYLRFDLGTYGERALTELGESDAADTSKVVRQELERVMQSADRWDLAQKRDLWTPSNTTLHGVGDAWPDGLLKAMNEAPPFAGPESCSPNTCHAVGLDVDRDGQLEFIGVHAPNDNAWSMHLFDRDESGTWQKAGDIMSPWTLGRGHMRDDVLYAIGDGQMKTIPSRYDDLEILGRRLSISVAEHDLALPSALP